MSSEREGLIAHLQEQVEYLATLASELSDSASAEDLATVRDHIFTIRETLQTMGVPLATVTNAEWHRAIGTADP